MPDNPVVIVGAKRTPIGSFQGQLAGVSATELGSTAIGAALADAGVAGEQIDECFMGCVLPANLGQAPARQAALGAGIPTATGCVTVNKVCGSGMKTIMLGHDVIAAGSADAIVAGGMESMTNAPYMLGKARAGYRMGHERVVDHMLYDGLENPYDNQVMGAFGELCVDEYGFTREEQDAFAKRSLERAVAANEQGTFADEIVPVTVKSRKKEETFDKDEEPYKWDPEVLPKLRPAFRKENGTITPASSSKISDGAAATVLMREREAERAGVKPIAAILGHAGHAQAPEWFTTAPAKAIDKLQRKLGWTSADVDLYEINEAFAAVAMAAARELDIDLDKINVHGGACALGHPIGCTGTRLVVTLINALRRHGKQRGIAALCIGGGEATAIAVELR